MVFVGKSLCEHGSQNMIEPCLCGKPTFVGPYTENFRPVMSDLEEGGAIVQVPDEASLAREISRLWGDAAESAALGKRATAAVLRRQGVVAKCISEIRETLA
jgi:3-deoxy-D-manno-octulosonic-acid transferase